MKGVDSVREMRMEAAEDLVGRCQQLCERVLAAAGENPPEDVLRLQHDCVTWMKRCPDESERGGSYGR